MSNEATELSTEEWKQRKKEKRGPDGSHAGPCHTK